MRRSTLFSMVHVENKKFPYVISWKFHVQKTICNCLVQNDAKFIEQKYILKLDPFFVYMQDLSLTTITVYFIEISHPQLKAFYFQEKQIILASIFMYRELHDPRGRKILIVSINNSSRIRNNDGRELSSWAVKSARHMLNLSKNACMSSNICNLNTKHYSKTVNENEIRRVWWREREKREKRAAAASSSHILFS